MFGSVFCETVCGYCVLGTAPERDQTTRETPRQTVELYRAIRAVQQIRPVAPYVPR